MNIIDLKQQLLEKKPIEDLFIFVCPENTFLAEQYLEAILENELYEPRKIYSLDDIADNAIGLVTEETPNLNILRVDEFSEVAEDYSIYKRTVIICKSINTAVKTKAADYIVSIPKLIDWQVKDYISVKCRGIDQNSIDWLYQASGGDIYRIDNEIDKLLVFKEAERQEVFNRLKAESDMFKIDIFAFEKAVITRDTGTLVECFKHLESLDLEPMSAVGLLLSKYRTILFLCYKSGVKPEDIGISNGAAFHARQDYITVPYDTVCKNIEFLSSIDSRLKNGELDFGSKSAFLDYILLNVLKN